MKIAIVTTNFPRWEGDFRVPFIIDAAKAIQAKGHTIKIITLHQPGAAQNEIMDGLEIFRAKYLPEKYEILQKDAAGLPAAWEGGGFTKLAMFPYFSALWAAVAKQAQGYDIIHANWSLAGTATYLSKRSHQCPYIVTIHGSDIFKTVNNPILKIPVKLALKNADSIIAVSQALAEKAISIQIPKEKIQIIPTGVDLNKFPMSDNPQRQNTLLYVGTLIERKGLIYLLKAMKQVKIHFPGYKLLIVGEGGLKDSLERYTSENNLSEQVIFLGTQTQAEVSRLMREAKLFILPSTEEGQGAVLVEAMASGTPCIGSNAGGIPTVITPETGKVFEAGSSEALFKSIAFMLENENFWQAASIHSRERAVSRYSWDVLADSIIATYKKAL